MNDSEKIRDLFANQDIMIVAVTLDDGTPWAVPVKKQLQWGNAFEWDSRLDTEHSKAIKKRSTVSLMLFRKQSNSQVGFYAKANATLLEERKPGFGRYQAIVKQAWINDETFQKREITLEE